MQSNKVASRINKQLQAVYQGQETLARREQLLNLLSRLSYVAYLVYEATEAGEDMVNYVDLKAAWEDEYKAQTGREVANGNPFDETLRLAMAEGWVERVAVAGYSIPARKREIMGLAPRLSMFARLEQKPDVPKLRLVASNPA